VEHVVLSLLNTYGIKNELISPLDNPAEWLRRGVNTWHSTDAGVAVDEKRSLAFVSVYRAVTLNATAIATQPKHLMVRNGNSREVASDHPVDHVLYRQPNREDTPFSFFELMQMHTELWGNFYGYINRDGRYNVRSIDVLYPWEVQVKKIDGRRWYRIKGENDLIPGREILHIAAPSLDGVKGVSPIVQVGRQAIGIGLVAEKYMSAFFGEGTHQGGVIMLPNGERLGDTEEAAEEKARMFRSQWSKTYGGPENFFKLLVLEEGMKFEKLGMELEAAQILTTRKFQVEEVARMFGIPPSLLFQLEAAGKYNNIEMLFIEWVQTGLVSRATRIEHEVNKKLLKESERDRYYFKINLNGLMRGSIKDRVEYYKAALGSGGHHPWMVPNEVREKEDMNEREGWDEVKLPANIQRKEGTNNE
jgi:HK97 family phage portal protein